MRTLGSACTVLVKRRVVVRLVTAKQISERDCFNSSSCAHNSCLASVFGDQSAYNHGSRGSRLLLFPPFGHISTVRKRIFSLLPENAAENISSAQTLLLLRKASV